MAIAIIGEMPNGNAQMDQAMMEQMGLSITNPPAGGLARLAGPVGENMYRIVSVWESEDAWNVFKRDYMAPLFEKMNQPMPNFELWQLDSFLTPQR